MSAQTPELLPCPFCGSTDIGGASGIISCYGCHAESGEYKNIKQATAAWNRRQLSAPGAGPDSTLIVAELTDLYDRGLLLIPMDDLRRISMQIAALRAPQAAPQGECEEGHCLIAEAEGSTYQCSGKCAYSTPSIEQLIANDSFAMTFQNIGQYRTALLKNISAKRKNHG